MAELITYREAVAEGIAREMRRDPSVVCIGEDIGAAGGVFKTAQGLFERVRAHAGVGHPDQRAGDRRRRDGRGDVGLRPVAEIMFSDFLACCWDFIANEMPKVRYMTGGQVKVPLVVRTANGGGLGFGAQHSQAVENWALTVPGLVIAAPSTPADVIGLMASAIRSDDPVIFFEHKALFATKGEPAPEGHVVPFGQANIVRTGSDITLVGLGMVRCRSSSRRPSSSPRRGSRPRSIDLRTLVPLDAATVLASRREDQSDPDRRGEPLPGRLGRNPRVDRGRRGLLRPRRAGQAAGRRVGPAAVRHAPRGPGAAVGRRDRGHRRRDAQRLADNGSRRQQSWSMSSCRSSARRWPRES